MSGNYNNGHGNKCPICGKENIVMNYSGSGDKYLCYYCSDCGEFFAPIINYNRLKSYPELYPNFYYNKNHLRSYLFYNNSVDRPFLVPKNEFEEYDKSEYVQIYNLTPEMVEDWYPKTFAEKIDLIILWLASQSSYMGEEVVIELENLNLLFFMHNPLVRSQVSHDWGNEFRFIIKYLVECGYIANHSAVDLKGLTQRVILNGELKLVLTESAWKKVYDVQREQTNNKNVFVAMKFGEETQTLREKIKEGLAGYNVRIMDEIEHNHQIVPEMLYEIRNSKFVIAELSNHNNGAYYEAGYALGLGKEVIHICKKSELTNGLHFDVAQVNTIVYDNIDEIPEKLKKRIQATIK